MLPCRLIIVLSFLAAASANADTIRWGFSPSDPAPYVVLQGGELGPSITRALGERVADRLNMEIRFVEVPNNRIDRALRGGRIDLTCHTMPAWHQAPDQLIWSKPLYHDADVIVVRAGAGVPTRLADMRGMRVGTAHDQHYPPELVRAFRRGLVQRMNVRDARTRLRMVEHDRLDASVERRYTMLYYLNRHPDSRLQVAPWALSELPLRCAAEQEYRSTGKRTIAVIDTLAQEQQMADIFAGFGLALRD